MCSTLKDRIDDIDKGLNAGTTEMVWKAAHGIKGSALQCSLSALAEAAKNTEHHFKGIPDNQSTPEARTQLVNQLRYEVNRVLTTANKMLAKNA